MSMFKRNARLILGQESNQEDTEVCSAFDYKVSQVSDIVTAYKSLKAMLVKA